MALSPEKNDVDITKLFHWGSKFEIVDRFGNRITDSYLRLIGDAELNRARVFAIRRSAELRKELRTEGSDERIAFISSVMEVDEKEDLIKMIISLNIRQFAQDAAKELVLPMPKEPKSDAALEEFEKYQHEVDTYSDRRNEALNQAVLEKIGKYTASIENMPLDGLKKLYEKLMIDELCERRMVEVFREVSAYYGIFKDPDFKERMFPTFEEFENLPTEVKEQYINDYNSLEINIDELKKSLEATL